MKKQAILLNGPSSSGKSTLAKALQMLIEEKRSERYEVISIDDFMKISPMETIYEDDVFEISADMCLKAREILEAGSGVIIDHVITSERIFRQLLEMLHPYPVRLVQITCPLEILRKREEERGNRCPGSAEASAEYLYPKDGYELTVDTGNQSPEEIAGEIFEKFASEQGVAQKMKLIEPTMEYDGQIQDFRREYLEDGGSMDGGASLRRYESTSEWLDHLDPLESEFICIREEDGKMVGLIQIRQRLNEFLGRYAGHIGYSVRPSERKKGYATWMLSRILPECERLGIYDILVCCLEDNEASRRTILANGGVYESKVFEPKSESWIERYWIHLPR